MVEGMSDLKKLHVAFQPAGGADWSAGAIFYDNVFRALKTLDAESRPTISIICDDQTEENDLVSLADEVIKFKGEAKSKTRAGRVLKNLANRINSPMDGALKDKAVDLLFTTNLPENWAVPSIPLVAWIPDFQHLRMPELFSQSEIQARSAQFLRLLQQAKTVVVTSKDVQNDLANFFPAYAEKCKLLNFATSIPTEMLQCQPREIADSYRLPSRFFYLPNQFWRHKNHIVVLEALEKAVAQCPELTVVATGNLRDYRHPHFLDQLLQTISAKNLRANFIVLGLIPRPHTFALMRQSLAVLQPSLFEGLSMTVAEAKVLGKQIIASDIVVLRELAPPGTVFFAPSDAEQLSGILVKYHQKADPDNSADYDAALARAPQMVKEFSQSLMKAFV